MSSENQPPIGLGETLLAAAQQDGSWIVQIDDTQRTLTTDQIVDAYNQCLIDPETWIWVDGMATWQQLQAVDPLVDALHARADEPANPPPTASKSTVTAARNDDSALFSLATLMSDQRPADSTARGDDSGLIDLRAIAAAAQQPAAPLHDPLPQPDLFLTPQAAVAPPTPASTPVNNNRAIVAGLLAAVAVLSALLVFQIMRSGNSAPVAQPVAANAPATTNATPIDPPEPIATPKEASKPPGSATPTPDATQKPEGKPKIVAGSPARPASRPTPPATTPTPPTPRTEPKTPARTASGGGCQCTPSDLDCYMRCAVK